MIQDQTLTELETSILMTLTYADLKGRPLTLEELHRGLFTPREVSAAEVASALDASPLLRALLRRRDDCWLLEGREAIIDSALRRDAKMLVDSPHAALFVSILSALPLVQAVYSDETDGALFVVARPGFRWTVTAAALAIGRWLGRPGLPLVSHIVERDQELPAKDVFTAQRLSGLRAVSPGADAGALRAANLWAREYFANAFAGIEALRSPRASFGERLLAGLLLPVERIVEGMIGHGNGAPRPTPATRLGGEFDRAWRHQLAKAVAMSDYLRAYSR